MGVELRHRRAEREREGERGRREREREREQSYVVLNVFSHIVLVFIFIHWPVKWFCEDFAVLMSSVE